MDSTVEKADSSCPICGASPIINAVCPGDCGSLEGLPASTAMKTPSRTFGYDWANGFVAPFLGIDSRAALDALQAARVGKDDVVVDLGCGDGRVCWAACSLGAKAIGYDLDEKLISQAKSKAEIIGSQHPTPIFCVKDLFEVELSPFSVLTIFLLPETTASPKLADKLLDALTNRPSTRIISFGWEIPALGRSVRKFCHSPKDASSSSSTLIERWFVYDVTSRLTAK